MLYSGERVLRYPDGGEGVKFRASAIVLSAPCTIRRFSDLPQSQVGLPITVCVWQNVI
jgi:hypothetical protein